LLWPAQWSATANPHVISANIFAKLRDIGVLLVGVKFRVLTYQQANV
jgi:hypothetical protein